MGSLHHRMSEIDSVGTSQLLSSMGVCCGLSFLVIKVKGLLISIVFPHSLVVPVNLVKGVVVRSFRGSDSGCCLWKFGP